MGDHLRDRIAAVIHNRFESNEEPCCGCHDLADAVIRELGLREEFGALDAGGSGALYDSRNEIKLCRGETIKRRYITEWEADG